MATPLPAPPFTPKGPVPLLSPLARALSASALGPATGDVLAQKRLTAAIAAAEMDIVNNVIAYEGALKYVRLLLDVFLTPRYLSPFPSLLSFPPLPVLSFPSCHLPRFVFIPFSLLHSLYGLPSHPSCLTL